MQITGIIPNHNNPETVVIQFSILEEIPLAWELQYTMGGALKRKKKKGNFRHRHIGEMPCEYRYTKTEGRWPCDCGGRDWNFAATAKECLQLRELEEVR